MSNLSNFIIPERVLKGALVKSRKRIFEVLAHLLDTPEAVTTNVIYQALFERERLGSTAIGKGVVIPHARVEGLSLTRMAVVILDEPLKYDTPDNQLVDIFIGVIFPKEVKDVHLSFMAHLTGLLRSENFRNQLREAESNERLYQLFSAQETV
jgi:PTS system nitrogen regulatory IIA component